MTQILALYDVKRGVYAFGLTPKETKQRFDSVGGVLTDEGQQLVVWTDQPADPEEFLHVEYSPARIVRRVRP